MFKKLILLSILASLISASDDAFAQVQCQNNKRPMTQEQDCCCKEVTPNSNSFICHPMTARTDKKCPGIISSSLTQTQQDEEAKYKTKISTQKDDSCICQFTIQ